MSNDSNASISSRGIGLAGILTVIFVLAKLFGVISWSWGYVFLPVIISFGLSMIAVAGLLITAVILAITK